MPTPRKPARVSTRKMPIGAMTAKAVNRLFRRHNMVPKSPSPTESLFGWFYWNQMSKIYGNNPRYRKLHAELADLIRDSKPEMLSANLERKTEEIIDRGSYEEVHAAVSFLVNCGFIDAPKIALIRRGFHDLAGVVEEGRGDTTRWETVITQYARADSLYHLRRLKRELPNNIRDKAELNEYLYLINRILKNKKKK